MKNKGFTLIEMLIVIVLMSIIFTLAIPSVIKITEGRSNKEYKTQRKLIEQAATLYQHRYKGDFDNNPNETCYILDYQTLLDEDLLEEQGVKCTGKIYFTKNSKNNMTKSYFLKCTDKNNVILSDYQQSDLPTGCSILGIEITESTINSPSIKGGNNNWVPTNIDISIENSGIELSDVEHYEYYTANKSITPTMSEAATGTTDNKVTISKEGTTYIWYRVINKNGDVSGWSNRQVANIDKQTPQKPIITANDGVTSGSIHTNSFILKFGGGNNISGNTYYYGLEENVITNAGSSIMISNEDNNKTYYIKSCSGAGLCSEITTYIVKF